MIDAIIEAIFTEVTIFSDTDNAKPFLAKLIAHHYNLLHKNYLKFPQLLGKGIDIASNDVVLLIRNKVEEWLLNLDVTMPKLEKID